MRFLNDRHAYLGGHTVFGMIDVYSSKDAILITMIPLSIAQHVFISNTFIDMGCSVVLTYKAGLRGFKGSF